MTINLTAILLLALVLPVTMLVFPNQMGALMQAWLGASSQPRPLFVRLSAATMLLVIALVALDSGMF